MKANKPSRAKSAVPNPVSTHKKPTKSGKPSALPYQLILFALAFLLYGQSVKFDFAMDDNIMIKLNKSVQKGTAGIGELFTKSMVYGSNGRNDGAYRPLTMISFALDKQLFNNNPSRYHLINILLYGLTGMVVLVLLMQFFPTWHLFYPFLMALLFMAHPVHTEVVANIKSRDEILCFLFSVLAMLVVFKGLKTKQVMPLVLSFVLFLLACLSKETALTLVAVVPISFYFFTPLTLRETLRNSLPFFAGAFIYMALRSSFLDSMGSATQIKVIDNTLMAAHDASQKYATILFITWKYLWLLIFPHPLSWDYSIRQIPICTFREIRTWLPLLLFAAMTIFTIISWKSRNIFAWCILFFFLTLSLVLHVFIPIAATMAERFLYFPSLAFCIFVVAALIRLFKTDPSGFTSKRHLPVVMICGMLFLLYSFKTYSRTGDWKNNLALFESGVKASPNSTRTHSALAYEYTVQAEKTNSPDLKNEYYTKSIHEFKRALEIYEGNKEGWYNIAHTYDIIGRYDEAETYYKKAIQVDPKSANAYNNLGAIFLRKKRISESKDLFRQAISLDKKYADPLGNLGAAFHFENNFTEAIRYYELALAINPQLQTVQNNIVKARQSLTDQATPVK